MCSLSLHICRNDAPELPSGAGERRPLIRAVCVTWKADSDAPVERSCRGSDEHVSVDDDLLTASYEIRLQRPIDEVWAFLTDLPNTGRWRQRMDVSWVDPGRTFKVTSSFGPWRKMTMTGEVTANEPPRRFAYRIIEGPLKARNEYLLEPDGDETQFTMSGGAALGRVTRLLGPVLRRAYGRTTRQELRRLQQLLS